MLNLNDEIFPQIRFRFIIVLENKDMDSLWLPIDDGTPIDIYLNAYRAAGGAVDLAWFPDMPHGFASKPGVESDRALEIIKDFARHQQNRSAGIMDDDPSM